MRRRPARCVAGPLWGNETHVREPSATVSPTVAARRALDVDRFTTGAEFRDFFKSYYGPTIAAYRNIADDPARVAELDQVLADLGDRYLQDGHMPWEYLLFTARPRLRTPGPWREVRRARRSGSPRRPRTAPIVDAVGACTRARSCARSPTAVAGAYVTGLLLVPPLPPACDEGAAGCRADARAP